MSKLNPRAALTGGVVVLAVGLLAVLAAPTDAAPEPVAAPVPQAPAEPPPPVETQVVHTIQSGDVMGRILPRYGEARVDAVLAAAAPHFDLTRIQAGKELAFTYVDGAASPSALTYRLDEDRTLVIGLDADEPVAQVDEIVYDVTDGTRVLTLNGSLWNAAIDAGLRPGDIVRIAEIFQWEVDFNSELRAGATFSVVGQELWHDGEFVKMGELHAVRLENDGKVLTALHHVMADGDDGWFHPDGTASKRPFLRSPLKFSRVTSNFNPGRYHPVLKKKRPHMGTDFGAATGTAVYATGDGVITFAATNGGHGKHIVIDHAGPYKTKYSHLSSIKVRKGATVKQGDLIGLVGSTGMSTGPHLHYEFHVNGKAVNAMTVDLPNTENLPDAELQAFALTREQWAPVLDAIHPVAGAMDAVADGAE